MASDELIMLDIKILPCAFIKEIFNNAWRVMVDGAEKKEGKLVLGFKVIGENRLIAVFYNGSDLALKYLNAAYGNHCTVTSTRFRMFESFASHVLGCPSCKKLSTSSCKLLNSAGKLFWVVLNFNKIYKDTGSFINKWREEAEFWLNLKQRGDVTLEIFKVLGQKEVHLFIRCPSADILDDLLFTTPISVWTGDHLDVSVKSLQFFTELINHSN